MTNMEERKEVSQNRASETETPLNKSVEYITVSQSPPVNHNKKQDTAEDLSTNPSILSTAREEAEATSLVHLQEAKERKKGLQSWGGIK